MNKTSWKGRHFQGPAFHKANLGKVIRGWRKTGSYSQPCRAMPVSGAYISLRGSVPTLCVCKELTESRSHWCFAPLVERLWSLSRSSQADWKEEARKNTCSRVVEGRTSGSCEN